MATFDPASFLLGFGAACLLALLRTVTRPPAGAEERR